jgi:hypothetical protein
MSPHLLIKEEHVTCFQSIDYKDGGVVTPTVVLCSVRLCLSQLQQGILLIILINEASWVPVAQTCNPSHGEAESRRIMV